MKYYVRSGDFERELEFERRDGRLVVRCGDRTLPLDFAMIGDGAAFSMLVGDRVCDVIVERNGGGCVVQMQGERYRLAVEDEHERAAGAVRPAALGGRQSITAAMPGAVVEVMVEPGQQVEAGATLLVLEAMKMQNPVQAQAAGRVVAVHVAAGKSVAAGALLVEIEPA
jgi:3-methylcrotonyl-CoA carboxylase alpha subunit